MSLFEKRNFPREEEEVGKEEKSTKKETIFDFSEVQNIVLLCSKYF